MKWSRGSTATRRGAVRLALLTVSILFVGGTLAQADTGYYQLIFNVPPVPEDMAKSGPGGWGALVLTFDGPTGGNGLQGATFKFMPACYTFLPGMVDDLNSDFPHIQLGPGGYGLGETGTVVTSPSNNPSSARTTAYSK